MSQKLLSLEEILEQLFRRGYNHGVSHGESEDGETYAVKNAMKAIRAQHSVEKLLSFHQIARIMVDYGSITDPKDYDNVAQAIYDAQPSKGRDDCKHFYPSELLPTKDICIRCGYDRSSKGMVEKSITKVVDENFWDVVDAPQRRFEC